MERLSSLKPKFILSLGDNFYVRGVPGPRQLAKRVYTLQLPLVLDITVAIERKSCVYMVYIYAY